MDNTSPTATNEKITTLPDECFSPGGIDCTWYRDCLEVRYPCEGTEDSYAISYAERYCKLFMENYNQFTTSGRQWVDGVRQCLQLALVPALRPWMTRSCAQLSREAFDSHPVCYLNPGSGIASICDLPCSDAWTAFYVVNVIGDAFISAPVETGIQMLKVMQGCFFGSTGCTGIATTTLTLAIPGYAVYRARAAIATRVGLFIATALNLADNGIGWFPYYEDEEQDTERRRRDVIPPQPTDSNDMDDDTILMLLVDMQSLGVSTPTNIGRQTLEETVTAFADAVSKGQLSNIPVTLNDTEVVFSVATLGQCEDTFCSNTTNVTQLAVGPTPPTGNGASTTYAANMYVIMAYIMMHCVIMQFM